MPLSVKKYERLAAPTTAEKLKPYANKNEPYSHARPKGGVAQAGAGGNLVSDAHLAAVSLEYDATVNTYDSDFGRFPGVRWSPPPAG